MCGFGGLFDLTRSTSTDELRGIASRSADSLKHRGPDDSGVWADGERGVALAHRRLSILDLSSEGHQPMSSRDGRFIVVFNGEIYNYRDLRADVERVQAVPWRGHSDTEVMLEAFSLWGPRETISRLNGMFAFALWDRVRHELLLVRDRVGEKPLYYAWIGRRLVFGSELRAVRAHPMWKGTVNKDALQLLLRHNYIPAPLTIYNEARKLPPGNLLVVDGGARKDPEPYWSAAEIAEHGSRHLFESDDADAVEHLDQLLRDAVRLRMEADVPLGAFLSGGIDSSIVVALMQAQSSRPVHTFSIGFREERYNEAVHAAAVAKHIGTDHTELYVSTREARDIVPKLAHIYDEPFADSSQIPTCLLAALTRRHVTVSLSGDGGDELFCGYTRYAGSQRDWNRVRRVPALVRTLAGRVLRTSRRGRRASELLSALDPREFYLRKVSHWNIGEEPSSQSRIVPSPAFGVDTMLSQNPDIRSLAMDIDIRSYLPDDILVKVDRAAMAVGLETRILLLDHRIIEFAYSLPLSMKSRDGIDKWILRKIAYRYVPRTLLERPKQGFSVPIGAWLRGPLRDWAEELLAQMPGDLLNKQQVMSHWNDHIALKSDESGRLWTILMIQAWLERERLSWSDRQEVCLRPSLGE